MTKGSECIKEFLEMQVELFKRSAIGLKGYKYGSLQEFLLNKGKVYESKKLTKSELRIVSEVRYLFGGEFQYKQCYYNAMMALTIDKSDKLNYVEGVATNIIPMDHAWLEINEKVVDLTWKEEDKEILGEFSDKCGYIGVVVPKKMVVAKMIKSRCAASMFDWKDSWSLLKDGAWMRKGKVC